MNAWSFLSGLIVVVGIVVPTAVAARRVRRRWFGVDGAAAVLVEATAVLAQLYAVAYLLGSVGWFHRWAYAAGCLIVGAAVATAARRAAAPSALAPPAAPPPDPASAASLPRAAGLLALVAVVVVSGQYLAHSLVSIRSGTYDSDTLWYHGPLAAHFVQDGWITRLWFEGGERLVTYYPDNGELAAAVSFLPFHRDGLLPVLNLGWLALALLAGWCVGARRGHGAVGVTAVAAVASLPVMASREAGTLGNDLTGLALLLVSAALLVLGDWKAPWLVLSGVAAGLAFGVKLSLMPPVAVLALAVLVAAPAARHVRAAGAWSGGAALAGAFWPVRDWVRAGNPFPWVSLHLGPLHLAAIPLSGSTRRDTSVLHYLGRPGSWGGIFAPGLRIAFGPAWPVFLVLVLAGVVSVVTPRPGPAGGKDDWKRADRALAAVSVVGVAVYMAIPNAVFPPPLARYTFADTSRYGLPALAVGLVLLSRLATRVPFAVGLTALLAAVVVTDQFPRVLQGYSTQQWPLPAPDVALGLVLAIALAAAAVAGRSLVTGGRLQAVRWSPALAGLPVLAGLAVLWPLEAAVTGQYARTGAGSPASSVFSWGRHLSDARIAVSGGWGKYPLYGPVLDNHVEFVSRPGWHGTFVDPTDCASWRRALDAGRYQYLVLFPASPFVAFGPSGSERDWLAGDAHAILTLQYRDAQVWRLLGPLDPALCPPAPPLPAGD